MTQTTLTIAGMSCAACQHHVERALRAVPGVDSATVNLLAHTAHLTSAHPLETQPLINAVRHAGYDAALPSTNETTQNHTETTSVTTTSDQKMQASLGWRALLSLLAGALAMLLSMPLMANTHTADPLLNTATRLLAPLMPVWLMALPAQPLRWFLCALALAVMLFAAREIYLAAWRATLHRTTNMNTLVALGTLVAFASSLRATLTSTSTSSDVYFESVILILAFLLTGRWLEARARHQATRSLEGFAKLSAPTARLIDLNPAVDPATPSSEYASAPDTVLPIDAIQPGDLVRILAGDRIPLDGIILSGRSSINESLLTGEPLPVTRTLGDRVTGGALNLDGVLIVRATAVGAASTLAQMQRLLRDAQSTRAPMQRLADRASALFVPTILILAAIAFTAWVLVLNTGGRYQGFAQPLAIAIAVLIIACPCAMGLAVPAAVTVALGRAARAGLLIKGGESLERLSTLDTLVFDKTGTLTEGRPKIVEMIYASFTKIDHKTLIAYAAAIESLSTHPLAEAVVNFYKVWPDLPTLPPVEDLIVLPGIGLTATIDGHQIHLGNASIFTSTIPAEFEIPKEIAYATPLYLLIDNQPQAVFFATDQLRPEAAATVRDLRTLGLNSVMLTGDIQLSAEAIAREAGITDVHAALLPSGKLDTIRQLQSQNHRVGMAGDGINDAAALAQSDAGFAMSSGADLAREAGDVLLLHADLRLIPAAIRLSRRTLAIMRQNLGWAFLYNIVGIPVAAGILYPHFRILLSPVLASAAMALSSVSVLANSLRLRDARIS
ncbi:MAG TPA: heavy metal translocating P-type ATPase [Acidobacteriaceae bacterium]|jgi:Cu+-exporting ATPase|nr:heavy metal translocating P-type ATPase [Acidobacteriaceae bacterium]